MDLMLMLMLLWSSDSVRLVNGSSVCSGRLEVKTHLSNPRWSSVCEADFDLQDAEVVCWELGCGAPSVLKGVLYGKMEAPLQSREFQCRGDESTLQVCRSSDSTRTTCSSGKLVELSCSEPVRLVGGASRCAGSLQVDRRPLRPVMNSGWTMKEAAVACRELGCGSAVSMKRIESSTRPVWHIKSECVQSGFTLSDCTASSSSSSILLLTCSDSVRLVNGFSVCSGRLEVKTHLSNPRWSSVCEADFDLQDAEVVCRELGCGAPSVLQGVLYREMEAPLQSREFQCRGDESALQDCRSSDSTRTTCSSEKLVGLTCSEPVRLVGGANECAGSLQVNPGEWKPVDGSDWTLKEAAVACRELGCGSAVSLERRMDSSDRPHWWIKSDCVQSGFTLRDCSSWYPSSYTLLLTCSDSVRLVNGSSVCSGRLEVKTHLSNPRWSSVCEADFDLQDAEVVCRELGCGAPSVLQGVLYREMEAPLQSREFQCRGDESTLQDCRSSDSTRTTCSSKELVGLTCSEPVRLVGGASRCAGSLQVNPGEWKPVDSFGWTMKEAAVACRELGCGSALEMKWMVSSSRPVWRIYSRCVQSGFTLRDCSVSDFFSFTVELTCSAGLVQPHISVSSVDGVIKVQQQGHSAVVRGSIFTISCSIQPQYPEGFFQLNFTSSNTAHIYTQPAVNHSAHFLFPDAELAHRGSYSCVYHINVSSHSFFSKSHQLILSVSDPTVLPVFMIRLVILLLSLLLIITMVWFKVTKRQKQRLQENMELDSCNLSAFGIQAAE